MDRNFNSQHSDSDRQHSHGYNCDFSQLDFFHSKHIHGDKHSHRDQHGYIDINHRDHGDKHSHRDRDQHGYTATLTSGTITGTPGTITWTSTSTMTSTRTSSRTTMISSTATAMTSAATSMEDMSVASFASAYGLFLLIAAAHLSRP
ncbi:unnamed protein product [Effrenium voratum]|nr:unnamed protein product [Effrenium voratum]